jgi:hypothetical protein
MSGSSGRRGGGQSGMGDGELGLEGMSRGHGDRDAADGAANQDADLQECEALRAGRGSSGFFGAASKDPFIPPKKMIGSSTACVQERMRLPLDVGPTGSLGSHARSVIFPWTHQHGS